MFPILQSPHDVALIFRTCQLHTAWELLHENGGNERQAAWHGKLHWQGRQHPGKYQTRRFIDTGILYPRQDVQALPPKVSKVAKSLPVQVSKANVKPPQSLLFHCVLGATSHHKESFPAPAASLAASAPAPFLAAPVLEPGHHCFLLQGSLCYGGQVHTVVH